MIRKLLLLLLTLFLYPSLCFGAITIHDSASYASDNSSSTSITLSFTVTSGADKLIVGAGAGDSGSPQAASGVTWNSDSMTKSKGRVYYQGDMSIWYIDTPDTGTHDVVVTWPASFAARNVYAFTIDGAASGAEDVTGEDDATDWGQMDITLTTTEDDDIIADVCYSNYSGSSFTWGTGQTEVLDQGTGDSYGGSYEIVGSAGNHTQSCQPSQGNHTAYIAVAYKPSAAAAARRVIFIH